VLILLPPSEGKADAPARGRPLDLDRLSLPELTEPRQRLLAALVGLCEGDAELARETLGLSPGLAGEVGLDRRLLTSPTRPAADLYTGVLYDSLGLASLPVPARRRANRWLLVFSGLWGALRMGDRIPPYRLSADVVLPGLGTLAAYWREPLAAAMAGPARTGLVLDLRSTGYAALWRPDPEVADRTVTLRVVQEIRPGDPSSRTVVSHFNKATKGRLVRSLLLDGADPRTPAQLTRTLGRLGYVVEPTPGASHRPGRPHPLDVVVTQV
jgi:cytoplasmic iron level regulating protein YaaA (DUF328/UPF0246 family)